MAFGLTSTGFSPKRFADVVASLQTRAKATFGDDLNVNPDSVIGQIISTVAFEIADVWELGEAVNNASNPLYAEGQQLDDRAAEVGIARLGATATVVSEEYIGDLGTIIPSSMVVSHEITGEQYQVETAGEITESACSEATIEVTTVANSTLYTINVNGSLVSYTSDGSATNLEIAAGLKTAYDLVSGLTDLATCVNNLDGTLTVTLVSGELSGLTRLAFSVSANLTVIKAAIVIDSAALVTGPVFAPTGKITVIETSVAGLDSVRNRIDGVIGRDIETDSELRIRRIISLKQASAATKDAILAEVLSVTGVSAAYIFENTSIDTDGEGRPGKSFEVIVSGGDDQDIADAIWRVKPAGIETTNRGSAAGVNVVDSAGYTQTVYFSRPTTKTIYVNVTYELFDEETFPVGGATTIAETVVDYGNAIGIGKDIIPQRFFGPIYSAVPGIVNLTVEVSDDDITYQDTKLVIDAFENPTFELANVSVTLVP